MKGLLYVAMIELAVRLWDAGDWLEARASQLAGKVIKGPWPTAPATEYFTPPELLTTEAGGRIVALPVHRVEESHGPLSFPS